MLDQPLKIDWQGLHSAFQMNMPEVKCFFDKHNAGILKLTSGDQRFAEVRQERDRFVAIEAVPSRIQYQWLDEFTKTVDDEPLRIRMEAAINGKGAFRRFKDILLTSPDERRRWFEFRDLALRKRIVDWVHEHGIESENEPNWDAPKKPEANLSQPEDVEALRDHLIAWFDGRDETATSPMALESLADDIGQNFKVKLPKKSD